VRPLTAAPVRWGALYGLALLALLSHLLLDYTNNYGLRPFYPFNPHWYAASIVFIFDPLMFAMLLAGLVAPSLFGLVSSEVGVRRQRFRGRGWASAALLGVVALWTLREVEHTRAIQFAMSQSIPAPVQSSVSPAANPVPPSAGQTGPDTVLPPTPPVIYLAALRALANPGPLSPFRWQTVTDFGPVYQLAEVDTADSSIRPDETLEPKPGHSSALLAAESSRLGRFYMNWSPMPLLRVSPRDGDGADGIGDPDGEAPEGNGLTVVTFRDPRFMGPIPWLRGDRRDNGRSPLSATVVLDAAGQVVRQSMGVLPGR
jgi:inner membrane protein